LPVQGKPLNAWRASRNRVANSPIYQDIINAVGAGWDTEFDLNRCRYEKIILLFDPDADGIHASMLVLMFFYRWMRPLLDSGRIHLVRAPAFQITYDDCSELICMDDDATGSAKVKQLIAAGKTNVLKKPFRGLGSMGRAILSQYCLHPETRLATVMQAADAQSAIAVFSPGNPN
jgi:DNA gyrase subunit B/topoisomerase-4 subunit B